MKQIPEPKKHLACRVDAALKLTKSEVERQYGVAFQLPDLAYRAPDRPNETQCYMELPSGEVARLIANDKGEVSIFTCEDARPTSPSYWTNLDKVLLAMGLTEGDCSWVRTGGPFGLSMT